MHRVHRLCPALHLGVIGLAAQTCRPAGRHDITDEDELRKILRSSSGQIRPVGSSHSFSPLVPTDGHLIVVDQLNQIRSYDQKAMTVTLGAGARLGDLGAQLDAIGQGMINLPDIDRQTIAGAMATGTHGTGVTLPALSIDDSRTSTCHPKRQCIKY